MLNAKQLVWRCRRGVRELDVLFGRFLETEYPKLDADERASFEQLLEVQDPVIMDWLFGRQMCEEPGLAAMIVRLQELSGL